MPAPILTRIPPSPAYPVVRWAGRNRFNADVSGPGLFDIFYWQTEPGLALHIVNYTPPALLKGPARAICPVGEQRIRLVPFHLHPHRRQGRRSVTPLAL